MRATQRQPPSALRAHAPSRSAGPARPALALSQVSQAGRLHSADTLRAETEGGFNVLPLPGRRMAFPPFPFHLLDYGYGVSEAKRIGSWAPGSYQTHRPESGYPRRRGLVAREAKTGQATLPIEKTCLLCPGFPTGRRIFSVALLFCGFCCRSHREGGL